MDAHHGRKERREQIERELVANPDASNREIARKLGVDHKTVAAVRDEIPQPNSPVIPQSGIGEQESGEFPQSNSPVGKFNFWDVAGEMIVGTQMAVKHLGFRPSHHRASWRHVRGGPEN
jgi:hypothetical protein